MPTLTRLSGYDGVDESATTWDPDETTMMETSMALLSFDRGASSGGEATSTALQRQEESREHKHNRSSSSVSPFDPDETVILDTEMHGILNGPQHSQTPRSKNASISSQQQSFSSCSSEKENRLTPNGNDMATQPQQSTYRDYPSQRHHSNSARVLSDHININNSKPISDIGQMSSKERIYRESYASIVTSLIQKNRYLVHLPKRNESATIDDRISDLYQHMETRGVYSLFDRLGIKNRGSEDGQPTMRSQAQTSKSHNDESISLHQHEQNPMGMDESNECHVEDSEATTVETSNLSKDYSFNMANVYNPDNASAKNTQSQKTRCISNLANATKGTCAHPSPTDSSVSSIELVRSDTQRNNCDCGKISSPFQSPIAHKNRSSLASKKRLASTSGKKGMDSYRMRHDNETSFVRPIYEDFSQQVNEIMNSPTHFAGNTSVHSPQVNQNDSSFLESALFSQSPIPHRDSILTMDTSMALLAPTSRSAHRDAKDQRQRSPSSDSSRSDRGRQREDRAQTCSDPKVGERQSPSQRDGSRRAREEGYSSGSVSPAKDQRGRSCSSDVRASVRGRSRGRHSSDTSMGSRSGSSSEEKRGKGHHDKRRNHLEPSRKPYLSDESMSSRHLSNEERGRDYSIDSVSSEISLQKIEREGRNDTRCHSKSGKEREYSSGSSHNSEAGSAHKDTRNPSDRSHQRESAGRERLMRRKSFDSANSTQSFNGVDNMDNRYDSFENADDSIESADSEQLREQERRKRHNDETIIDDDQDPEHSISLKDNSRLYYDPLKVYRPPRWVKNCHNRQKDKSKRPKDMNRRKTVQINRQKEVRREEPRPLPTMTLIQDPFKEFGSRDAERLEVVSEWLLERDATGTTSRREHDEVSSSGRAVVLSVMIRHIVSLSIQVLLNNGVHKISRRDRHVESSSRSNLSSENKITQENGGTLIIAKSKEALVEWECCLRENTGFAVLNHAELSSIERRRVTMPSTASGFDIVLTTYDALKTKETTTSVDDMGRHIKQTESQGGWLTSRMAGSEEQEQKLSSLSHLHTLTWFRLVFIDNLGRQSYLTKPGTARAQAACALKAESR